MAGTTVRYPYLEPQDSREQLAQKNVLLNFSLKMYGYILESRVVGEPIIACGNGFQFPSLSRERNYQLMNHEIPVTYRSHGFLRGGISLDHS